MAMGMESCATCLPMGPCVRSFMSPEIYLQRFLPRLRGNPLEDIALRRKVHGAALEHIADLVHVVSAAVGRPQLLLRREDAHAREDAVPRENRVALADA